ncbi:MAG TPA: hypothetical protein PKY82_31520 [Pyrinomonadaceae bacterium]|nr:hypothetical protein [Pyrinomonadaceae bacterium]
MSKLFRIIVLILCFVILVNVGFAQKTKAKPVSQTKVDLGKLQQNTYTNDSFRLKIEFPLGWLVGDNELEKQLYAIQQPSIKTKNPKEQAALNQAMKRVTPLLGGYKSLPGSVAENSSLRIAVENLSAMPTVKTSQGYLQVLLDTLKLTRMPSGYQTSGIKSETIDGMSVNYVETTGESLKLRSYVIIRKGFAVLFKIESYDEEDFDALHQVLTEADLDYKK